MVVRKQNYCHIKAMKAVYIHINIVLVLCIVGEAKKLSSTILIEIMYDNI